MHNVILFGEAGSGKSSLINMIVGHDVAKVSGSADGCTFKNEAFPATIGNTAFVIYDTAGLNEGDQGRVPHWTAIQELYTLIRRLDGVSLLIYCMRGRVKENAKANWTLFNKVICGEKVPIIAVVTGLETYDDPDTWWKDKVNQDAFRRNSINPRAVGCVVSFRGRRNELEDVYAASQIKLRNLIMKFHLRKPWCEEKNKWFASVYSETLSSGLCFTSESRLEWTQQMRGMINEFIKETRMEGKECEKLETTLLKAEKKLRRKGSFKMTSSHNVIVFGESGCGKSSVVNMIVGQDVAKVSSESVGCTLKSDAYDATIGAFHFRIYDTAGLNEGDQGRVPHWTSVKELYTLIRKLDGVSLLIYCVRGRIKENTQANWILFNKVICGEQVPTIAVITGLENERDWQDQKKMKKFKVAFASYDVCPEEVASVVSIRGEHGEFAKHYETSQKRLRELVVRRHRKWSTGKADWFASIYHTTYTTRLCFSPRTNVEFTAKLRSIIGEFVQATSMSEGDVKELEGVLVKAEKKVLDDGTGRSATFPSTRIV